MSLLDYMMEPRPQYENHLDIKLHRVEALPADWYDTEADGAPSFGQHPFRYEVYVGMPAVAGATTTTSSGEVSIVGSFAHGRMLTPLPRYAHYVAAAVPPVVASMEEAGPLLDVPEILEMPPSQTATLTAATAAGADLDGNTSATIVSYAAAMVKPAVMWVATDKTDAASIALAATHLAATLATGTGADKRGKKKTTGHSSNAGSATATGVSGGDTALAPLPLPEAVEPPPCVVRVPLDAARQAHLEALLNGQLPLTLYFRRVLRPGLPPDWEDLNAAYFAATIPISLAALEEPGSLALEATAPLLPMRADDAQAAQLQQAVAALQQSGEAAASAAPSPAAAAGGGGGAGEAERAKKKNAARRNKAGVPARLYEDPDVTAPHPYLAAGTTATVSLSLQTTLTRLTIDRVRPAVAPQQLIPARAKPTPTANNTMTGATATNSSGSAAAAVAAVVDDIARKILRDYQDGTRLPTAAASQDDKEAWRVQFLDFFQSSGQLTAYRAQLTPLVVRLVHERFSAEGHDSARESIGRLSNELYVYLLDTMHTTLRRLVDAQFSGAVPTANTNTMRSRSSGGRSCECDAWRVRALEAEAGGDTALAATYHQARINRACACAVAAEEEVGPAACAPLPTVWAEAGNFHVRAGEPSRAEQCYREAIACDAAHLPSLLAYGMLLLSYGRLSEAAVFLHGAADAAPQRGLVWACVGLLDDLYLLELKEGSPLFEVERAKWQREHRYAIQQAAKLMAAHSGVDGEEEVEWESVADSPEQTEAVYIACARYAVQLHHHDLASVCLARCRQGGAAVEALYARIFAQGAQHADALGTIANMPAGDNGDIEDPVLRDVLLVLRAASEEGLGDKEAAIRLYKQALCHYEGGGEGPATIAPYLALTDGDNDDNGEDAHRLTFDPVVEHGPSTEGPGHVRLFLVRAYLRLGSLLLSSGRFKDALGVFSLGLQAWPRGSLLWLGAGVAYHRVGTAAAAAAAEECLCESNCLDPHNPRTWAYLALLLAKGGGAATGAELEQCLQQAIVHGLEDAALWAELGRELLSAPWGAPPQLAEVALRRGMRGGAATAAATATTTTCAYHLAHALARMHRWEEAKGMLEGVVRGSRNEVLRGKAEEELRELAGAL